MQTTSQTTTRTLKLHPVHLRVVPRGEDGLDLVCVSRELKATADGWYANLRLSEVGSKLVFRFQQLVQDSPYQYTIVRATMKRRTEAEARPISLQGNHFQLDPLGAGDKLEIEIEAEAPAMEGKPAPKRRKLLGTISVDNPGGGDE